MVKASERVGNLWVIDSGIKPGEKVIVEGIQRVRPGIQVSAKPAKIEDGTLPLASAAPADGKPGVAKRK
jgi:membrane fusion protein (multidrug efflux system)